MSDQYRLVFAGEVMDGQHPAVVKKRLGAALKLDHERLAMLFSGKSVVLKKATDRDNAARYQVLFKKAGARLRVMPVEGAESTPASSQGDLHLLPAGADLLTETERSQVPHADIDTSHISVQGAVFSVDEPEEVVRGPDVDHITLAEPGARIGPDEDHEVVFELNVDFSVAETGADMDTRAKSPPPPPPDTSHLQIDED